MDTLPIIIITAIIIAIVIFISLNNTTEKRSEVSKKNDIQEATEKILAAYNNDEITKPQADHLLEKIQTDWNSRVLLLDTLIHQYRNQYTRTKLLALKYDTETANKLINGEYWIGMTVEHLTDSKGNPTKVEKEVLKTKTKETYVYGNKSSGDYFVIENGIVTKIVDR